MSSDSGSDASEVRKQKDREKRKSAYLKRRVNLKELAVPYSLNPGLSRSRVLLIGRRLMQLGKQYSLSLLFLISWFYLLFPTSAPLALNGLPLDHKIEFVVFVALSLTIFLYCVLWYFKLARFLHLRCELPERPRFLFYLETAAIGVLLALLVFKLFLPESTQLRSCFEIPRLNNHRCVWLPEGSRLDQADQVSRFEDSITFGTHSRPWRLAAFNDTRFFNYFNQPEGTPDRKIQDLRGTRSYPFSATFRLGQPIAQIIRNEYAHNGKLSFSVRYSGVVEIFDGTDSPIALTYSEKEQSRVLDVPDASIDNLLIRYRNFRCADETEEPSQCARSLAVLSLPLEVARLEVAMVDPGDQSRIPLGYGSLAKKRNLVLFSAFALLEWLAGTTSLLVLLVRIYSRLSMTGARGSQFVSLVRQNLKLVFQLMLIATLSALSIRTLPTGLPILIGLGAAYVSIFCAVVLSRRVHQFFRSVLETLGPLAIIAGALPFLLYLGAGLFTQVTPMNEVRFLIAGDDAMDYATDAMGILENGSPRKALPFTHYLVKPLFLHTKAFYYAVFGGGETYYSFLITTAFVCVWSMTLFFWGTSVYFNADVTAKSSWIGRIAIIAASAVAYATLTKDFLVYGASFAANAFSEGPAWLFAVASFALVITLPDSRRPTFSLSLIGAFFAGCLCFRMQYIAFLPLLVFLCGFLRRDLAWKRILIGLCMPVLVVAAVLTLYFLLDPPTGNQLKKLFGVTSFRGTFSWDLLSEQAKLIFPSSWEFTNAAMIILLLIWFRVVEGGSKRLTSLLLAYLGTVLVAPPIFGNHTGYYPRHIVIAFFLSSCALIALIQHYLVHKASLDRPDRGSRFVNSAFKST